MSARLELISLLLSTFKSTRGLGVEETLKFTKQGLDMADDKARQAAVQVGQGQGEGVMVKGTQEGHEGGAFRGSGGS